MGDLDSTYIPPVVDDTGGIAPASLVVVAVAAVYVYLAGVTVASGVVVVDVTIGAHRNLAVWQEVQAYISSS